MDTLLPEYCLPVSVTHCDDLTVIAHGDKFLLRRFIHLAGEIVEHAGAVVVEITARLRDAGMFLLHMRIAQALHDSRDSDVGFLPAFFSAGQTAPGHSGADLHIADNKGSAAGGVALLAEIVGKGDALIGDAVYVGCLITAYTAIGMTDITGANIITPDHRDVGHLVLCLC